MERVAVLAGTERRQWLLDERLATARGGTGGQEQVRFGLLVELVVETTRLAEPRTARPVAREEARTTRAFVVDVDCA